MRQQNLMLLFIALFFSTNLLFSQNPLLNQTASNTNSPSYVGGSVAVNVNDLVSNDDAQRLLDRLGGVTIQLPIQSFYANPTPDLVKLLQKNAADGFITMKAVGNNLHVALADKAKGYLVNSGKYNGVETWFLAMGYCNRPLVSYTSPGTMSGRSGQTLTFSIDVDLNSDIGNSLGFKQASRSEYQMDIFPTSAGWVIDQNSINIPIKQAASTAIGKKFEKIYRFCEELPRHIEGKTWTRSHKKENKRFRYTFFVGGNCRYFDAKAGKLKTGSYTVRSNYITMKFLDGDGITLKVDYGDYGKDWLRLENTGAFNFGAPKFYATPAN